jgi:hypothetical protein
MATKTPKTELLFIVQSNWGYGHGWEDVTAEKTRKEALDQLRAYRANEPGTPHRLIRRREKIAAHASRARGSRRHGNMKFIAGHPLPVGAHFKLRIQTLPTTPNVWHVSGPRVVRGGRVDYNNTAYYGTINKKTGALHIWGGRGAAGEHYKTYLEVARDRLKRRFAIAARHTGEPLVRVARQKLEER